MKFIIVLFSLLGLGALVSASGGIRGATQIKGAHNKLESDESAYKAAITQAITKLNSRTGSSSTAIKEHIQAEMGDRMLKEELFLKSLKDGVASGDFVKVNTSYKRNMKNTDQEKAQKALEKKIKMEEKASEKRIKMEEKARKKAEKKEKKKQTESYSSYIYNVLKEAHPGRYLRAVAGQGGRS